MTDKNNDKSGKDNANHQEQKGLHNKSRIHKDDPERNALHRLGTGFEFLGVLALAAWLGYKADNWFDSGPTLMIFFFISAFVTMIYLMIKGTFGWKK